MKKSIVKLISFVFLVMFFLLFSKNVLATTCPSGWTLVNTTYCGTTKPPNVCCGSLGCDDCEPWCYKYDPICCAIKYPGATYWDYRWQWSYDHCSAADRCCSPSQAIRAGICDPNGCATGGWYKTCCQVAGGASAGNRLTGATGSCSGGICSSGTCVRAVGCDSSKCLSYQVADCWYLTDCFGPTPTPASLPACPYWCQNAGLSCPPGCTTETGYSCSNGGPCCNCPAATSTPTPTLTPTPTPALVMPSCANVSGSYDKNTKKLSLTYTYTCNNSSPAKLNVAAYYRPPSTWAALGSSETLACPAGPTSKTFTSGPVADGTYELIGSLYAFYDLNNNNVFDSQTETRVVCTGNPDYSGGATCPLCRVASICADPVAPPAPAPTVSSSLVCPGTTVTVSWAAVTDPSPSCGGLSYRYKVSVDGVEKASGTTSQTSFSTNATTTGGTYLVEVFSRDGSGNESGAGTVSFTVDAVTPA